MKFASEIYWPLVFDNFGSFSKPLTSGWQDAWEVLELVIRFVTQIADCLKISWISQLIYASDYQFQWTGIIFLSLYFQLKWSLESQNKLMDK